MEEDQNCCKLTDLLYYSYQYDLVQLGDGTQRFANRQLFAYIDAGIAGERFRYLPLLYNL